MVQTGACGMNGEDRSQGEDFASPTYLTAGFKLGLHSEMAYMNSFPPRIAFFCQQASGVGG
jgi:hypothetical protein